MSEVVCRVLATHSIRQLSLQFPSRASPLAITFQSTSLVVKWSELLTTNHEVPGSIPGSFFPPSATQSIVGVYFTALYRALVSSRTRLLDHTQRRATVGRTPLNE